MSPSASVGDDDAKRLFLALRLPADALDGLSVWSAGAISGCRRVARDDLHVTLAFLGRQPAAALPAILRALREEAGEAGLPSFTVDRWRETRSVGMVVLRDLDGSASRLARNLHERLERLGVYRREARPWLAHITVCRFHVPPRLRPELPVMGTLVPSDAAAYLSHLHPSGARYEVLDTVRLGNTVLLGNAMPRGNPMPLGTNMRIAEKERS